MINSNHVTCDICGVAKGATNHWQVAIQAKGLAGIMFVPSELATVNRTDQNIKAQDICGNACATKRLSQYFQNPQF